MKLVHRKKQFNTGIQALTLSKDGGILFSSGGQKEVAVSQLRIEEEDILSVEFGGYRSDEYTPARNPEFGGDLRIMGIDAREQKIEDEEGYLIALVLSDSTVKA